METPTLELEEPTEVTEKLLIYQNDGEISRITNEAQARLDILRRILASGLKLFQIAGITETPFTIGKYIFGVQLSENSKLKELHDAGISGVTADLPEDLQRSKNDLTLWHNYKLHPGQNKLAFLKVDEVSAELDQEALENYFIQRQLKIYLVGEKLKEFHELQMICEYFTKNRMPSNQLRESSFLWARIEPIGSDQYKPRWQWFIRERN